MTTTTPLLDEHTELVQGLAAAIEEHEPRARVRIEVQETYRNMRSMIDKHPKVVAAAEEAIRRAGLEPVRSFIRGGTDGARLSEIGLPTAESLHGRSELPLAARVGERAGHGRRSRDRCRARAGLGRE